MLTYSDSAVDTNDDIQDVVVVDGLLLEWLLQNMLRHFVTHKQAQADKRHPI